MTQEPMTPTTEAPDLVERVAREICISYSCDPDVFLKSLGFCRWELYRFQALAAIAAMPPQAPDMTDLDREAMAAGYILYSGKRVHASDCATSCAPAMKPGPCDCDTVDPAPSLVSDELKPCPFCGSAGMWVREKSSFGMGCKVQCSNEDCAVERGCWYGDDGHGRTRAAEVWNTRTDPSAEAIALLVEVLKACRDQFRFYANEHFSAGKLEKAATNQTFADLADKAMGYPDGARKDRT